MYGPLVAPLSLDSKPESVFLGGRDSSIVSYSETVEERALSIHRTLVAPMLDDVVLMMRLNGLTWLIVSSKEESGFVN